MRLALLWILAATTIALGAWLALDVLFWVSLLATGTSADGPDPNRPGHLVCLNPPLVVLVIRALASLSSLYVAKGLVRAHKDLVRTVASNVDTQRDTDALFSRWH